jgi:signal transduction histidine kinase
VETGLRWVAYTLETELLMNEIEDATHRISHLVDAAKQYTQLDRAAQQDIDVHDGLDSTLVMLGVKLAGVRVVKDYDRDLPVIPAYPAELNQVWTNLIDNAVGAMNGDGTLTLRTALEGDHLLVEVGDTGPGVPAELTKKIFEPFFTTKPVGKGTGLGLDISYRAIAQRHGGDLRVHSEPGNTRFQVRLPLQTPRPVPVGEPVGEPAGNPAETAGP